ncbi:neuroligin-1 [Plakobranchus ocellatus]|uniref:Carboxylic ester hydrolase n=1 Tax=Plakobranchus ocellatus TaxID=259542 RepID=A0AAV3Z697_9GAST|nr:neuroligin-1 [Plakobranchus ocellatus]
MESSLILFVTFAAFIGSLTLEDPRPGEQEVISTADVVVSTSFGHLKGVQRIWNDGEIMNEFKGIPYAQPPIGDLRFASPEPPLVWSDVRDATSYGHYCPQEEYVGLLNNETSMSEDCLYLNIFSPSPIPQDSSPPLPVMVWIHGGAFYQGAGSAFDGSVLASRGQVVVVTINYRLGPLGFLSTEDDVIPGNFGMLDQVMALKWIRLNIRQFGGDPDRVAVFGVSAGAHSATLLSLSPLSKGLFHRAIAQSGGSITPTSLWRESDVTPPREAAVQLATKVGCLQQDSPNLLTCLRSKSWEEIHQANPVAAKDTVERLIVLWKPRVDGDSGFLPEKPDIMLSKGLFADIETMHGYCADEMSGFINDTENDGVTVTEFREKLASALSSYRIRNKDGIIKDTLTSVLEEVDSPIQLRSKLIQLVSNFQLPTPIIHEIDTIVNSALPPPGGNSKRKHFLYRFSYRGNLFPNYPTWAGVPHSLDVPFVFGLSPKPTVLTFLPKSGLPLIRDLSLDHPIKSDATAEVLRP